MNQSPKRSTPPDMAAQKAHRVAANLKAYVDGELAPVQRWWVERHIGQCAACRTEVATLRRLASALKSAKDSTPKGLPQGASVPRAQLRTRILANLPDSTPMQVARIRRSVGAQTNPWSMRMPALAAGSFGALLLLVIGAYAHNQGTAGQHPALSLAPAVIATADSQPEPEPTRSQVDQDTRLSSAPGKQHHADTDPFAVPATPQSGTDAGSRAHTELVSATAQNSDSESDYTDPISREADRLAATPIAEHLKTKSQVARATSTAPSSTPLKQSEAKTTVDKPLVLGVEDLNVAFQQVKDLATSTGATVANYSLNPETGSGTSASATPGSNGTGAGATAPTPIVLKISIPIDHLSAFTSHLGKVGIPLVSSSKGTVQSKGTFQPKGTPQLLNPIAKRLDLKDPFYEVLLPRPAHTTGDQPTHEKPASNTIIAPTTITFYLRLQK